MARIAVRASEAANMTGATLVETDGTFTIGRAALEDSSWANSAHVQVEQ